MADPKIKTYFLDEFIPNASKNLLINKGYTIPECLMLSNQIIIESMKLFNKLMYTEDVGKLSEMFKNVLEPSKAYYKFNNQDENDEMPVNLILFFLINQIH